MVSVDRDNASRLEVDQNELDWGSQLSVAANPSAARNGVGFFATKRSSERRFVTRADNDELFF